MIKKLLLLAFVFIPVIAFGLAQGYSFEISSARVSEPFSSLSASSGASLPSWLHDGSYLNYSYHSKAMINNNTTFVNGTLNYSITSINVQNEVFNFSVVTTAPGRTGSTIPYSESFNKSGPFPVLNSSFLNSLKNHLIPKPLISGYGVSVNNTSLTSVSISIDSLRVSAYEIDILPSGSSNFSQFYLKEWYDSANGVLLKVNVGYGISPNRDINIVQALSSTNFNLHGESNYLLPLVLIPVIAVVAGTIAFYYYHSRKRHEDPAEEQQVEQPAQPDDRATSARIEELNSLLSQGLISREFYDESVKMLKRGK